MTRRGLLLLALAARSPDAAAGEVQVPSGYRMGDYRAPTPHAVPGGRAISTDEARVLHAEPSVVWIDVLPAARRPEGLPPGTLWRPSPRLGIPGSIWLPEAGRGFLSTEVEAWFRDTLARATGGDLSRPIVFYCLADCWMSWNAARRAALWGYRAVYWYRDGTDGWEAAGQAVERLHPEPGAP